MLELIGVAQLFDDGALNPFRTMLLLHVLLAVLHRQKRIHFRTEADELGDDFAGCLVLEFADDLVIADIVKWVSARIIGQVEEVSVLIDFAVDVSSLNLVHEGVCVCEEQVCAIRKLLLNKVIVKFVHVEFRQFEYCETHVEGLVDHGPDFAHLDARQVLVEDAELETVGLLCQLLRVRIFCDEPDVSALLDVLAGLPVHTVIHQLKEILLKIRVGLRAEVLVQVNIGTQPRRLIECQYTVDF